MNATDTVEMLRKKERALKEALAEFEHEARRVRDHLERRGGHVFTWEDRLNQLEQNIAVTHRDLETVRDKLASTKSKED